MRYQSNGVHVPLSQTREALAGIIRRYKEYPGLGIWPAFLRDNASYIGWFCLKPMGTSQEIEIGFRLLPAYWSKGYATEGGQALLNYAFAQLKLNEVQAKVAVDNTASIRVLEKLGLQRMHRGVDTSEVGDETFEVYLYQVANNVRLKTFDPLA